MGFLNLLRAAQSINRDCGGLPQLALVRPLNIQLIAKHNNELKKPYSKKNKHRSKVAELITSASPPARSAARLQHVSIQSRTRVESHLQSIERTRERLGVKKRGQPHIF
jgi:hypothetical protein